MVCLGKRDKGGGMGIQRLLFRHTRYDAIPALCAASHLGLLLASWLAFAILPSWAVVMMFCTLVFCYCWNVQSISHNFIHNPFFANEWLNRAFSILESVAIGIPQTIYYHYHMNHHWGDNDAKGAEGKTRDWGSTYRHGKGNHPEAFWKYCLIGFFRFELTPCFRMIFRYGPRHVFLLLAESLVLGGFWLAMLLVNWRYFLFFYLPNYYLGWVLIYAHTYVLHYGARPDDYYANSVSSYHAPYNWMFFNNGFHQEHHWDPKAHWTKMPQVREEILPQMIAHRTRILLGPHITAFLEDWLRHRSQTRSASEAQPHIIAFEPRTPGLAKSVRKRAA
jgi:fatty acid desaturase